MSQTDPTHHPETDTTALNNAMVRQANELTQTDKIFETLAFANHPETGAEHHRAYMEQARNAVEELENSQTRLFIHEGKGHYIGSVVIVEADTLDSAKLIVRAELDRAGLKLEPLDVKELPVVQNKVLYFNSGDY